MGRREQDNKRRAREKDAKLRRAREQSNKRTRELSSKESASKNRERAGKAKAREQHAKGASARERAGKRAVNYHGTGWCETFHTCSRGDGRNFWAWVKGQGYKRYKGACANTSGRYGRRHKYWHGRWSFSWCRSKCDAMGAACQGITMPTSIRMTPGGNERRNKAAEKKGKADAQARERAAKRNSYTGTGWCETFYTCKRGDGRNFWAWTKAHGYRRYKGACAHSNGRYGKRHKYWHGRYTFNSCKAKC